MNGKKQLVRFKEQTPTTSKNLSKPKEEISSPFKPIYTTTLPSAPTLTPKVIKWDVTSSLRLTTNRRPKEWKSIQCILAVLIDEYAGPEMWRSVFELFYWMLSRNIAELPSSSDRYVYGADFNELTLVHHNIYYLIDQGQDYHFHYTGKIRDMKYSIVFSCSLKPTKRDCYSIARLQEYKSIIYEDIPDLTTVLTLGQVKYMMLNQTIVLHM
ncbi:matrix protein [Ceratitis capitata sigmavirus]|uniref:Matrix protein n=1 Tax=Ceratitis capitata sigmavirus TaxID=1802949 RepID=A0A140D8P5_9RHAB|nr:matrix protein [Ceratitis capitata sigmavirus]AMK09269.1 matrix protein [Ceratitis capitata sigmavirus]